MTVAPLKISYCTTCKGRLHHLRETLPANMAAEHNNPNVEFVVLDYGSEDGLGDWIKGNFGDALASGRLKYVRTEANHFEMAHAKNMAHRMASGDVLCNLDADNYLAPNFSRWLEQQFAFGRHAVVSCQLTRVVEDVSRKINRIAGRKVAPLRSVGGRIAIRRDDFERLGGYNEKYTAWGEEDVNLVIRAREAGLDIVKLPEAWLGDAIQHGHEERVENLSQKDKAISMERLERTRAKNIIYQYKRLLGKPEPIVNNGNVGCGEVTINFADAPTTIGTIPSAVEQPVQEETMSVTTISDAGRRADWAATHGSRPPQIGKSGR